MSDRLLDFEEFELVQGWDDALAQDDHSTDASVLALLREGGFWGGLPITHWAPITGEGVRLALAAGVDFSQRGPDGETVLFMDGLHDDAAFTCLADHFADLGLIDAVDNEGLTALSAQVKFGQPGRARVLLERGASPNTVAHVARLGGAPLSVAMQAANPIIRADNQTETEMQSIALLTLLRDFGLSLSPTQKAELAARAASKPALRAWIEEQL